MEKLRALDARPLGVSLNIVEIRKRKSMRARRAGVATLERRIASARDEARRSVRLRLAPEGSESTAPAVSAERRSRATMVPEAGCAAHAGGHAICRSHRAPAYGVRVKVGS